MALKIRLQRGGTTNAPTHQLVVTESKNPRDGKFVEKLGTYNPQARGQDPVYKVNVPRIEYWLGVGAQPSDTVKGLIKKARKQIQTEEGEAIAYATA